MFQFETFRLSPETKMIVDGNRPLEIRSLKDIDISGNIDISGADGGDGYLVPQKGDAVDLADSMAKMRVKPILPEIPGWDRAPVATVPAFSLPEEEVDSVAAAVTQR